MKNKLLIYFTSLILVFSCYSQFTVSITNMTNLNTASSINNPITIDYNSNIRLGFNIEMSKPSNQVINGNLYVYTKKTSGSSAQTQSGPFYIANEAWSGSGTVYYNSSQDITLYALDFNPSGGSLYAEFVSDSGPKYSSDNWSIAVTSPPIANNSISGNQTIYTGQTPSNITGSSPSGGNGSYSYSWQLKTTGSWSTIGGATGKNYTPGSLNTTTDYRRIVASGTAQNSTSNTITVTVVDPPVANNSISGTQTIDEGETPATLTGSTPTGGDGTYSFSWQKKTTGSWFNINGATSKNFSPGSLLTTTSFRRMVNSGDAFSSTSNEVTVTVNNYPLITNNSIAFDGTSEIIGSIPAGGNGVYEYEYYISVPDAESIEHWSGLTSNKDYEVPMFFLSLSESYEVFVRRTVKSGIKTSNSNWITLGIGLPDIGNNNVVFDNISQVNGSNPTGGNGSYEYAWEYTESATLDINTFSGETDKDLTVPVYMMQLPINFQVRRIVNSGNKSSTSEWVSVYTGEDARVGSYNLYETFANNNVINKVEIKLFPNPTQEKVNFKLNFGQEKDVIIRIYSPSGKSYEVFNGKVEENGYSLEWIPPAKLSSGVYYYQVIYDQTSNSGKFIYNQ